MDYGTAAGGLPGEGAFDLLFADAFLFFWQDFSILCYFLATTRSMQEP